MRISPVGIDLEQDPVGHQAYANRCRAEDAGHPRLAVYEPLLSLVTLIDTAFQLRMAKANDKKTGQPYQASPQGGLARVFTKR